ncbi:hypothetical protein [Streptococcus mutans]|uniref:hypothetical protein n=1 Tax=Streptococcus mutans TaxID=1309 RepID=UPI0022844FF5|nr:hypothetical protein [Streptococcus mutans]MCY7125595.1 hypothetical protein [Streptococcus mutans]
MIIFVSLKKLVQTFWWLIAAIAFYVFYKTIGLSMAFLLIIGLLALYFAPFLFLPILLIAIGVHFTGGFSFIADTISSAFVLIVLGIIYLIVASEGGRWAEKRAEKKALKERQKQQKH